MEKENKELKPRYILDVRTGCAAVRDTHHPDYDKDYPGLHSDTLDVVEYRHGYQNSEKGCWEVLERDILFLEDLCEDLNLKPLDLPIEERQEETQEELWMKIINDSQWFDMKNTSKQTLEYFMKKFTITKNK